MKKWGLAVLFALTAWPSQGQVGDIIDTSLELGEGCSDGLVQACGSGCADVGINLLIAAPWEFVGWLGQMQQEAMANREVADLTSLDLQFAYGRQPGFYRTQMFAPRLRFNWGLFSFGLRHTALSDTTGSLRMTDISPLIFNLVQNDRITYRAGLGFSLLGTTDPEGVFSNATYGQIQSSLECYFRERLFALWLEGRMDFGGSLIARSEAAARLGIRALQSDRVVLYGEAGFVYQVFFQQHRLHLLSFGLRANIR